MEEPQVKMEGPEAAYAQGDLYADVMAGGQNQLSTNGNNFDNKAGRPLVMEYKSYTTIHPKSVEQQDKETKIAASVEAQTKQGKQLYIGGLTWWTNDEELGTAIQNCGVNDVISIKFSENRINGQSKGFALLEVESEQSQRLCMDRLPNQLIHNQKPVVTFVNKQTLGMFETQARKDIPGLAGSDKRSEKPKPNFQHNQHSHHGNNQNHNNHSHNNHNQSHNNHGGPHIIHGLPPPGANVVSAPMMDPNMLQQQSLQMPPGGIPPGSIIVDAMGNVIQGAMPGVNFPPGGLTQGLPQGAMGGFLQGVPQRPGVAPHINPAFIPQDGAPPVDPMTGVPLQTAGLNEQDLESMRRNQAVASTAIQRAMTDANAGEFESGIETLVTAISLIKQSTTANTEPAQVLVQSLQDCLQGLEGQLVQKGSRGGARYEQFDHQGRSDRRRRRDRSKSRSRSRERSRRSYSPHRSRSRERRRR